ncbi:putative inactive serine/threonine-protein kinase lvsG [Fasciola hepatica]|uniref:Inactive serine/threonine-protein kinase lvsG n=1 Tax=Fasciola hepatica TaxID=6192 RepID=A0A4E0RFU8_FASHE|nr:putative inactive serine/threonine-protein kinase lvsG [Fasciola hepatica]
MEASMPHERVWRFSLGFENFEIEDDCELPSSEIPYTTYLNFQQKLLEASWKKSFARNSCYLQHSLPHKVSTKTNYIEIFNKLLEKTKEFVFVSSEKNARTELKANELTIRVHNKWISLGELLKFSPRRLEDNQYVLYILFQITESVFRLHQAGLPHLGISLDNVFVDQNDRCSLGPPDFTALYNARSVHRTDTVDSHPSPKPFAELECVELSNITTRWVLRQCSNYDYIMYLNHLAGRTKGDPVNSAILPWVTDFTSPHSGLRDLTKSKYHLNKGEAQLDANYKAFVHELSRATDAHFATKPMSIPSNQTSVHEDKMKEIQLRITSGCATNVSQTELEQNTLNTQTGTHPLVLGSDRRRSDAFQPHHLLDVMPNLAYYTYLARRTPKAILTRFVRPIYQPNEFPPNIARLYQLTPEECIPEFFTDPSVFTSIHSDMPDLGLPDWCATPEQFIAYHLEVLESDAVSSSLHHWIDLTFGYKLIGEAAIQAKNVHLELAGTQHILRRSGITCLFRTPHPRRWVPSLCSGSYFGPCFPALSSLYELRPFAHTDRSQKTTEMNTDFTEEDSCRSGTPNSFEHHSSKSQTSVDAKSINSRASLSLPSNYDPLTLIHIYNGLCRFLAAETRHPTGFELPPKPPTKDACVRLGDLLARDVESIACLAVELFTHNVVNYIEAARWSHVERVLHASRIFRLHRDRVPSVLHRGLDYILTSDSVSAEAVTAFRPTTQHLLYLLFEFPPYFFDLHSVVLWLSQMGVDRDGLDPPYPRPRALWGPLSEVIMGANCSIGRGPCFSEPVHIPERALTLLYPHIHAAASRQPSWMLRTLQCNALWAFFYTVGGTQLVEKYLVPLLLLLYRSDYVERALTASSIGTQHPLSVLCSRCFLRLVMAYVSLDTFLSQIIPRVIHVLLMPSTSLSHHPRIIASSSTGEKDTYFDSGQSIEKMEIEDRQQMTEPTVDMCKPVDDAPYVDTAQPPSLSSLVDEIGLDLRSVDTEDELLDLIADQPKGTSDTRSPSMLSSNRASGRSQDSSAVQFTMDNEGEDSPSVDRFVHSVRIQSPANSAGVIVDSLVDSEDPETETKDKDNDDADPIPSDMTHSFNTIPPMAASTDSLIWIAKRVGPLITGKWLIRYLLAGLTVCYEESAQFSVLVSSAQGASSDPVLRSYLPIPVQATGRPLAGDRAASACLRCLEQLVCVYGVCVVHNIYIPFVDRAISQALVSTSCFPVDSSPSNQSPVDSQVSDIWNSRTLARVVAALTLMHQFVVYLPDSQLCDQLQDSTLQDLLIKAIRLAGRHDVVFPGGTDGRRAVLYKIIDCIYVIGLRIGFELTRARLTSVIQLFFALFDRVPLMETRQEVANTAEGTTESNLAIESEETFEAPSAFSPEQQPNEDHQNADFTDQSSSRHPCTAFKPVVLIELRCTFDGDLARLAYVPFCRLAGGAYVDTCVYNAAWIHTLIGHSSNRVQDLPASCSLPSSKSAFTACVVYSDVNIPDNQSVLNFNPSRTTTKTINTVVLHDNDREKLNLISSSTLYSDGPFHLRGAWLKSFECEAKELESSKAGTWRFRGHRIAAFSGHTARVNSIDVFPAEGCFLTTSHDKTVQLWSLSDSYNPAYSNNAAVDPGGPPVKPQGLSSTSGPATVHGFLMSNSSSSPTGRKTPTGAGLGPVASVARLVYREHRRPVFGAAYLPTYRLVASVDGQLILWDPCTGQKVHSGLSISGLTALSRCSVPGGAVLCADQHGFVHLIDPRLSASNRCQSALRLNSGASLAPIAFAHDRVRQTAGTSMQDVCMSSETNRSPSPPCGRDVHRLHFRGDSFPLHNSGNALSTRLRNLTLALDPHLSGPGPILPPSVTTMSPIGTAGSLRCLAQQENEGWLVICAFTSGLATTLDLRTGQIVNVWRAHSDSVVQVSSWRRSWFVTAGDRSLAFWNPPNIVGPTTSVVRTLDHCTPHVLTPTSFPETGPSTVHVTELGTRTLPGMMAVSRFVGFQDNLIVCGPASGSVEPTTASSGYAPSSSGSTGGGSDMLGVYRPSADGSPHYSVLGRIPSAVLRGRITALASLSESSLLLAGSSHGHLSLIN